MIFFGMDARWPRLLLLGWVALALVPVYAGAQTQDPPQKKKPTPEAKTATSPTSKTTKATQTAPVRPQTKQQTQGAPQGNAPGGSPANARATNSGGVGSAARTPNAGGGISGKASAGAGGITGKSTPSVSAGGITGRAGTTSSSAGAVGKTASSLGAGVGPGGRSSSGGGITGNALAANNNRPTYHPTAGVKTTASADGGQIHVHPNGTTINTDRGGRVTSVVRPGVKAIDFRADGHAGHIENARADGSRVIVDRGLRGERRVEVVRPGGVRIVSVGGRGFVERPVRPGFVARTYVIGGRTEVRVYRERTFGRVHFYTYVPRVYYHPAFYAWAYQPWGAPVAFAWGFGPSRWYAYQGVYFAPEPVYPTASLWLTDYLLAENLRLAYENSVAANGGAEPQAAPANNTAALSPEIKRQIAEEVQLQLAAERAQAQRTASGVAQPAEIDTLPTALDPKQRIFVVATGIDLGAGTQSCSLTPGDIVERTSRIVSDDGKVPISVITSKAGDCPVEFSAAVDVSTLQDMHNQFREQIAAGMDKLSNTQGKGLPTGPAANPRVVADGQAAASSDAAALLKQQVTDADKTEAEVKLPPPGEQP